MARKQQTVFLHDVLRPIDQIHYEQHPVEFVEDVLFAGKCHANGKPFEVSDQQKQIMNAVVTNKRVSARSGRGIGKTAVLSWLILWWLCVYDDPKVVCTAPSYSNLKSVLWPEVSNWLRGSPIECVFEHTAERLYLKESPSVWWAEPRTSNKPEAMAGLHKPNMLILMDEASGIDDEIYDIIQGSFTQANNKVVLTGNPTRTSGFFADSHKRHRKGWKTFKFSSEDSPNVDNDVIEYFKEKYGVNHNLYKVHVLGEFPSSDPDAFISIEDVEAAVMRDIPSIGQVDIGVDVARKGDDLTVICYKQGLKVYPLITKEKTSIPETTALVLETVKQIRNTLNYNDVIRIKVDDTGVGGGVTDELSLDRTNNIEVVPCSFGGKGDDSYKNEASIMWGNVREQIRLIELPDDRDLVSELSARRFDLSGGRRICIESKKRYKRDFGSSPDRADALVLCFARKAVERRILTNFDPQDQSLNQDITRRGYGLDGSRTNFCSLYYTTDMQVAALWMSYSSGKLFIRDELFGPLSLNEVVQKVYSKRPYTKIIGNPRMFNPKQLDLQTQFNRYNIFITENYRYDEYSAIFALEKLVNTKNLIISKDCVLTRKQLAEWKHEANHGKQERDHGLCYAILQVLSEVQQLSVIQPVQTYKPPAYGYNTTVQAKRKSGFRDNSSYLIT